MTFFQTYARLRSTAHVVTVVVLILSWLTQSNSVLARQLVVENVLDGEWITALSSNADGRVFAATRYGAVFQSRDNGLNWSEIFRLEDGLGYPWIRDLDPVGNDSLIIAHDLALIKLSLADLHADTLSMPTRDILVANDGSLIGFNSNGIIRCDGSGLSCVVVASVERGDLYRRFVSSATDPETHFFMQTYGLELSSGYLVRSTDDGMTWEILREGPSFLDVHEIESGRLLVAGFWGIGYTDDSAATIVKTTDGTGPFNDILEASDGTLFTVTDGPFGSVSRSESDGASWTWDGTMLNADYVNRSIILNDYMFFGTEQGVFRTSDPVATSVPSTNVPERLKVGLDAFPNPAESSITLQAVGGYGRIVESRVTDVLGREYVVPIKVSQTDGSVKLDVVTLSPGVYVATIVAANSVFSTTFVVAK